MREHIFGAQINTGDTLEVWWQPGLDTVIDLTAYDGPYKYSEGWANVKIATFALMKSGMTIFPGDEFVRLVKKITGGKERDHVQQSTL